MKHIHPFLKFINEQETKPPAPAPAPSPAPASGGGFDSFGDLLKSAGKILGDAGFIPADAEGGGSTWGERLQGSGAKVPTAEDVKKGVEAVNKAMERLSYFCQ